MHQSIDKKIIIIYLLFLLILSTTSGKFVESQNSYSSAINQINIKGLSNADNSKIYDELKKLFYRNILLVRNDEIQEVINQYNIVEEYSVKKIYPSTINISLKPTKLIARLSDNNQLVGANGKLIYNKKNKERLPYIFGEFNSQEFLNLKKNIIKSKFNFTKFKTLYFFPSNRWDILTNDNILIKLPKKNLNKSLNLAHTIIKNEQFKNNKVIDLRIPNRLIVQ